MANTVIINLLCQNIISTYRDIATGMLWQTNGVQYHLDIRISAYKGGSLVNKRKIPNKNDMIMSIKRELSDNEEAKYYHRLDLVMLAIKGMPIKEIASLYNESPSTISYWTRKAIEQGVESLKSGKHTGRKSRLTPEQFHQLDEDLHKSPAEFGYESNLWNGKILSRHLADHYAVNIQVRQCQRIMRQLGYVSQSPQKGLGESKSCSTKRVYKKLIPYGD